MHGRKQHVKITDSCLGWVIYIGEPMQECKVSKWKARFCISISRRRSEEEFCPQKEKAMLDQRPYIERYQVKLTTETSRITAAN